MELSGEKGAWRPLSADLPVQHADVADADANELCQEVVFLRHDNTQLRYNLQYERVFLIKK
jgi:hypothetical protein